MIRGITFTTRIGLILVLGLVIAWIAGIGFFYIGGAGADIKAQSDPDRVVAIVELMDRTVVPERALVERAISVDGFHVAVEPGSDVGSSIDNDPALSQFGDTAVRIYRRALAGRVFSIDFDEPKRWRLIRREWPDILKLRIALNGGGILAITMSTPLLRGPLGLPIGFGAGFLGTLVALIVLLAAQRETKPLRRLAAAVDGVDLSADPVPLPDSRRSAPEIRALIAAFNRLQGRLGELLRARMAMLGGISHDVRTFATRLQLRVEKIADPAERERATTDITDMIRLLDDALLASRAGASELSEEMVEIEDLVRGEVADRAAGGRAIDYRPSAAREAPVVIGDRLALRRVVANLADNAIKYGRAAHLAGSIDRGFFVLTVDDEGPGIPPGERAAMLEPFSRLETSRNRDTGGAGLGLAVARSLTEAHRGALSITEAPSGGARVTVRLPLFEQTGRRAVG
jgi:signal transduction histidine kinase